MHQILIYSESVTWGIIPDTRARLPFDERWPGVLENKLNASGPRIRVIEDCLNGRRTAWDDPFKRGRNGLEGLAQRITALINEIWTSPIEPGMPVPPVLVVCPPQIRSPRGNIAPKFRDAEQRCAGLAEAYMQVASGLGCHFFNASTVTTSSRVDGVHLDRDQHSKLGNALAEVVRLILTPASNRG